MENVFRKDYALSCMCVCFFLDFVNDMKRNCFEKMRFLTMNVMKCIIYSKRCFSRKNNKNLYTGHNQITSHKLNNTNSSKKVNT